LAFWENYTPKTILMQVNSRLLTVLLMCLGISATAQDNCSAFYNFQEGTTMEYTSYNKRGKVDGKTRSTISAVADTDSGVKATVENILMDKKGKEQMKGQYEVFCQDDVLQMDVNGMLNPAMQQSFSGMEVTIEGTALEIPDALEPGMELPDASTEISAGTGGMNIINMTVNITDRKVEGMEEITTPAGTYECYKLTQTTSVKMMMSREFKSVDYFAEGIGLVRSETYNRRGKLDGYMELTNFEKP